MKLREVNERLVYPYASCRFNNLMGARYGSDYKNKNRSLLYGEKPPPLE
jgi:hypothetical protein